MSVKSLFDRAHLLFEYKDGLLIRRITVSSRAIAGEVAGGNTPHNYNMVRVDGKRYYAHRIIFLMFNGYLPDLVDHRDQNTLNNKIENLREATKSQNLANSKVRNKSGFKGCRFRDGKWTASLRTKTGSMHLGTFITGEAAYSAYCKAAEERHGEFADHRRN